MSKKKTKNQDNENKETTLENEETSPEMDTEQPLPGDDADATQLVLDQQEQIAELERKVEELKESNLRKKAELDNMMKRLQRDRAQIFEAAKAVAVEHFLPVHDDLQRTIEALDSSEESENNGSNGIEDGVRLIYNKFQEVLKKYNVEVIDQTGVPFNVDIHDALMRQQPEGEEIDSDIVLQVLENGYKMGDRTIRHAKVIVSE